MTGAREVLYATGLLVLLVTVACDPYQRFGKDDDSYGPVDPVNFPPANLGAMGNRMRPGVGSFVEITAYAGGAAVGYFYYPLPVPAPASADLLRLLEDGKPYGNALATPTAYVFAPGCAAPAGYRFDLQRDEVSYDVQGTIFTALPAATYTPGVMVSSRYVPITAAAPSSAQGVPCQKLKSADALAAQLGQLPGSDGRYLAQLIIDPAAAVYPRDDPRGARMLPQGVGLQSWGWYNGYLLAYLDGGSIPTAESDVTEGGTQKHVKRLVPQKLYLPRSPVIATAMGMTSMAPGVRGAGYDVLAARRGEPGYSPLCEVVTYDAGMPLAPEALPRDARTIEDTLAMTLMPASPRYVFCLQVAR
jgi:hypothetical protein